MFGRDGEWSVRGGSRYGTPPHFAHTEKRRSENAEITIRRALAVSSHKSEMSFCDLEPNVELSKSDLENPETQSPL